MVSRLRVFISYSWKGDLDQERDVVKKIIEEDLLMDTVSFPTSSINVTLNYLREIKDSDIVVVLLGKFYSSNVENEFCFALEQDIPTLVFIRDSEHENELEKKINDLYRVVKYESFKTLDDLKKAVKEAIIQELTRRLRAHRKIEKTLKPLLGDEITLYYPKCPQREYKGVPKIYPF